MDVSYMSEDNQDDLAASLAVEITNEAPEVDESDSYDVALEPELEPELEPLAPEPEEVVEPDPEIEAEDKKKKKKHVSLKTEFNRVQRDNYKAMHELEVLRQENERLQATLAQTADAATHQFDKTIELKLEKAKAAKVAAYENADTDAMVKADELFTEAMNQRAENERWKSQQQYAKSQKDARVQQEQQYYQQQQQQYQQPQVEMNEETEGWLANNQWFDPRSQEYNQDLAALAHNYSQVLEQKYAMLGHEDKVFSSEYFNDIDRYISEQFEDAPAPTPIRRQEQHQQQRMNVNMKPVKQGVAPVGKTVATKTPNISQNRVSLSAAEVAFAKTMGQTPQEYAKYKQQIDKSGRYGYEQNRK